MVEIRSISREPGYRSKVAVAALQAGVDPVGACVGIRGVRIQTIVRELNDEKIDVIEWNPDPSIYIAKGLSPARVTGVYLDETHAGPKTATVVVPEDQLSLAIGRDGQNARLAAKLTGWRIDIKSLPEATSEVLFKLQNNPEYQIFHTQEEDFIPQIEAIMVKKQEGRPITPEEYHSMSSFVDRVEKGVIQRRQAVKKEYDLRLQNAREAVPEAVFDLPIFTLGLSEEINAILQAEEYEFIGDLMVQFFFDPTKLNEIEGIDEEVMEQINKAFDLLTSTLPEPEPEPEEQVEIEEVAEVETIEPVEETAVEETEPEVQMEEILDELEEVVSEEPQPKPEQIVLDEEEKEEIKVEAAEEEELPVSLEDIFKLKPEMLDLPEDRDDLVEDRTATKKKKKRRKKYVELEYDPDQDVTIYRKKHKRETDDWDEDWDF
jgi:N utilization substance protein A